MSTLKFHEKAVMEKIFDRGGYVLDFSDRTFSLFFQDFKINIDNDKYYIHGSSKMKRLRGFWDIEPDPVVSKILSAMLSYAQSVVKIDDSLIDQGRKVIQRLGGNSAGVDLSEQTSNNDFAIPDISGLQLSPDLSQVIDQRLHEIQRALQTDIPLSVIFLCGSTLEGILFNAANNDSGRFNRSPSAPTDKDGKVLPLKDWTLNSLIIVGQNIGLLTPDITKHSHSLKDFRNYIHPREQAKEKFSPDIHTAIIAWQVLKVVIVRLSGEKNSVDS